MSKELTQYDFPDDLKKDGLERDGIVVICN